jgi:GNAT superfamily N-acetyltransferase
VKTVQTSAAGGTALDNGNIRIEKIKLSDLYDFACKTIRNPAFKEAAPLPLIRALSQSKNPYGHPDDVVLLVAYSGDQCVGYQGLLPGLLKTDDQTSKVYWGMAWYVIPEFRRRGIGQRLLEEIKNTKIDYITPQMTERAESVFRRAGYKDLGRLTYFQLRVDRLNFSARFFDAIRTFLSKKTPYSKVISPALMRLNRLIYSITKRMLYRRAWRSSRRRQKLRFRWKVVDQIDESMEIPLNQRVKGPSFFRGVEVINWMLKHPWLVPKGEKKIDVSNFYFSITREMFTYVAIAINSSDSGRSKGFLVLSVSKKKTKMRVKILDFYFNHPEDHEIATYFALRYAKAHRADRVDFPASLENYFKQIAGFKKLIKKQSHLFMFYPASNHSPLALNNGKIAFDYCDGDTAFT